MIRGKWKDSIDRRIVLEDWDGASVSRLLELLYTGDYESPCPAGDPQPEAKASEVRGPETSVPSSRDVETPRSTPKSENAKGSQRPLIPLADNSKQNRPGTCTFQRGSLQAVDGKVHENSLRSHFRSRPARACSSLLSRPKSFNVSRPCCYSSGHPLTPLLQPPNSQPANCKYAGDQHYSYTGSVRVRNYY